jgi:eukaryotic-like serine/threonine-protein kinase
LSRSYKEGYEVGDRYIIDRYLDEGGMQEVYLATDSIFNREVVVKVPKNESAIKRFKRSARLSAKVTHPNVAKTFDYVEQNGVAHLVEEYIRGGNLSDTVVRTVEAVDPYLVARLLHHLARGLSASHAEGVVHRDIKPSNVVLDGHLSDDFPFVPKITDFGVAKMAEETLAEAVEGGETTITTSATALGMIPYMAPELINDPREVVPASDIWALGAVAYEMLAGKKPFGDGFKAVGEILSDKDLKRPSYIDRSDFEKAGDDVFSVIQACLEREVSKRPDAVKLVELTSSLCYGVSPRRRGVVTGRKWQMGTITSDEGERIFFHSDCVYGPQPRVGESVVFASFDGEPMPRAFPVLKTR